ncbi:MAG: aminopeptidase P family protein [Chloroflexi bacterium]|nr:MAG: aminopeptidase P family protein [Chloroflexota bacterium]
MLPIVAVIGPDPASSTVIDTATEWGSVEAATWIERAELYGPHDDPIEKLVSALRRRGMATGRLGLELGSGRLPHLSPSDLGRLRMLLPDAAFVDASDLLHSVRAIKSQAEINVLRRSANLIVHAFQAVCQSLRPGLTEVEMTRIASSAILEAGGTPDLNPTVLIFMAGSQRYRAPLLPATERPVGRDELISLDGGCSVQGYHSDFARGAVIGRGSPEVISQFDAVVQALTAAESAIRPGRPVGDAWSAAQVVLDDAGLGDAAVNPINIGHSIGLDHWERPTIARPGSEMGDVRARPGMVLCIEPQVAGAHGDDSWSRGLFLVEDQILVTDSGIEVLTAAFSPQLYVIGGT